MTTPGWEGRRNRWETREGPSLPDPWAYHPQARKPSHTETQLARGHTRGDPGLSDFKRPRDPDHGRRTTRSWGPGLRKT